LRKQRIFGAQRGTITLGSAAAIAVAALLIAGYQFDVWTGHGLRYERAALAAGDWWRLVTAHVAHLSWLHGVLNAIALLMILQIFRGAVTAREWWIAGVLSLLTVDAGLWWLQPGLGWYVGFSGILHGLFVAGIAALWRDGERRVAGLFAIGLVLKLAFEAWLGPASNFFDAPVITASHSYGAAGGVVAAIPMLLRAPQRTRVRVMRSW
jgi:rhomboid family GlyGly-CTERM serine protease